MSEPSRSLDSKHFAPTVRRALGWLVLLPLLSCGSGDKKPDPVDPTPTNTPVDVQASTLSARAGTVLTLTSSYNASAKTIVRFTNGGSYSVDVAPVVSSTTSVQVGVPPFLNTVGQHIAGAVTVQVIEQGVTSPRTFKTLTSFQIEASPTIPGSPGALTEAHLNSLIQLAKQVRLRLDPSSVGAPARTKIDAQIASLTTLLHQIQTLRQQQIPFSLGTINSNPLTIDATTLAATDQSIADMLNVDATASARAAHGGIGTLGSSQALCAGQQAAVAISSETLNDPDKMGVSLQHYAFANFDCTLDGEKTGLKVGAASGAIGVGLMTGGAPGAALARSLGSLLYLQTAMKDALAGMAASFGQSGDAAYSAVKADAKSFQDLLQGLLPKGENGELFDIAKSASDLYAEFTTSPKPPFATILILAHAGNGTISADPPDVVYTTAKTVRVSAIANSGSRFDSFSGDCTGTGLCILTMDANHFVAATFKSNSLTPTYSLDLFKDGSGDGNIATSPGGVSNRGNGNGTISVSRDGPVYAPGTVVTVTATPAQGSTFTGFSGACSGTTCSVKMDANKSVTATFTATGFKLTVLTAGTGTGSVGVTPQATTYAAGTVVTLAASPATGSIFGSWSGACSGTGTCSLKMDGDKTVTANFFAQTYTLFLNQAGGGTGNVVALPTGPTYPAGTVVTIDAAPIGTSKFAGFSGACSGTGTCTLTMNSDKIVTATFNSANTFALAISKSGSGSGTVTPSPAGPAYATGTQVILLAVAASGSRFDGYSGDCSGTSCVLTMNSNKTIVATFTKSTDPVVPPPTGGGRFDGNYRGTYSIVVTVPGIPDIVLPGAPLALRVNNGVITITDPAGSGGGSVSTTTGAASFGDSSCTFNGTFSQNGSGASAKGSWTCPVVAANLRNGVWTVTRQ